MASTPKYVDPPANFKPTHMFDGEIPVMQIGRPLSRFVEANGRIRNATGRWGHKALRIGKQIQWPPPEEKVELPPPPPPVFVPGTRTGLPAEVAAAALRAATWPCYGEAYGYAETTSGDAATLDGTTDDGAARVKVCQRDGTWTIVKVPRLIELEIIE